MQTEYFKNNILPLKNKLFKKAYCITESAVEAEDVVQEVMMRLWDKRSEWSKIENIEVYCMVLTKNLALDKIKKMNYFNDSLENSKIAELHADSLQPLENMVQQDEKCWLWKLIRSLPEKYREIIRLREMEEYSYLEIAQEMELTEAQVKIILFRARQQIKEKYLQIANYGLK